MSRDNFIATLTVLGFEHLHGRYYKHATIHLKIELHENGKHAQFIVNEKPGWRTYRTIVKDMKKYRDRLLEKNDVQTGI